MSRWRSRWAGLGYQMRSLEGLDFEEEEGDWDEGEVDEIILGEQEVVGEVE